MKCDAFVHDRLPDPETGNNDIIAIHLYPQLLSELYSNEFPKILSTKGPLNRPSNLNNYRSCMLIANYINTLLLYFDLPEMIDDDWILLKIKEFIHLVSKTNYRAEILDLLRTLFSPNEHSFKKIIEANIISNLNSGELAQLTNTSQGNFHRKFKSIFGESPARCIRNRRLDYAANMIMAM